MSGKAISLPAAPKLHSFWQATAPRRAASVSEGMHVEHSYDSYGMLRSWCLSSTITSHDVDLHAWARRFSGSTPVASTSNVVAAASSDAEAAGNNPTAPALTGELDSEITQLLRSLSKRDTTTKSKALQVAAAVTASRYTSFFGSGCISDQTCSCMLMQKLKAVVASKDASTVATCLPAWAYVYNKLVMDNNRFLLLPRSCSLICSTPCCSHTSACWAQPLNLVQFSQTAIHCLLLSRICISHNWQLVILAQLQW